MIASFTAMGLALLSMASVTGLVLVPIVKGIFSLPPGSRN